MFIGNDSSGRVELGQLISVDLYGYVKGTGGGRNRTGTGVKSDSSNKESHSDKSDPNKSDSNESDMVLMSVFDGVLFVLNLLNPR